VEKEKGYISIDCTVDRRLMVGEEEKGGGGTFVKRSHFSHSLCHALLQDTVETLDFQLDMQVGGAFGSMVGQR